MNASKHKSIYIQFTFSHNQFLSPQNQTKMKLVSTCRQFAMWMLFIRD